MSDIRYDNRGGGKPSGTPESLAKMIRALPPIEGMEPQKVKRPNILVQTWHRLMGQPESGQPTTPQTAPETGDVPAKPASTATPTNEAHPLEKPKTD